MKARTAVSGFRVDNGRAWRSKRPWPSFGGREGGGWMFCGPDPDL
ncbi:unnamed protein product [Ectocarpus sp. 12 AP-2014]